MLHKEFWGLLFLGFVVWVFAASDGSSRINRGCRPIAWGGNVAVSLTALALPSQQAGVKKWVDKVEYGCRYAAWRLFYQDDYIRALEQHDEELSGNQPTAEAQQVPAGLPASVPMGAE